MDQTPAGKGSYILITCLNEAIYLNVGALGERYFPPGIYCYCGSARGPGGLKARISHHIRPSPNPKWHFDYLKSSVKIQQIWYQIGEQSLECDFVESLLNQSKANQPVQNFGSRDCQRGCFSHLVFFPQDVNLKNIFTSMKNGFNGLKSLNYAY